MKRGDLIMPMVMGALLVGSGCSTKTLVSMVGSELPKVRQMESQQTPHRKEEIERQAAPIEEIAVGANKKIVEKASPSPAPPIPKLSRKDKIHSTPEREKTSIPSAQEPIVAHPEVKVQNVIPPRLSDVFFDFDTAVIRPTEIPVLERNARLLNTQYDKASLLIEGHCDERGSGEYNLVLGERRAQAVKKYLENLNISSDRLRVVSFGKEKPFCRGHNDRCWRLNRRSHFVLQ